MRLASILLRTLGTFYEQAGKSPLSKGLDIVYTEHIFTLYAKLIRNKLISQGNNIIKMPRFGYINWDGYNPSTHAIQIKDVKGIDIDMEEVSLITFPFSQEPDMFLPIANGIMSQESVEYMSEINTSSYPILYIKESDRNILSTGFHEDISIGIEREIATESLKIASIIGNTQERSFQNIGIIANIIVGAQYSYLNEKIEHITEDSIICSIKVYPIDLDLDTVLVSEGEEINGFTLLTRRLTLSRNPAFIHDIRSIQNRLDFLGVSNPVTTSYLRQLSTAISKRKFAASIPVSLLSDIGTEGVTLLTKAIGQIRANSFETITSQEDEDEVISDITMIPTVQEETICNINIVDMILCSIEEETTVEINVTDEEQVPLDEEMSAIDTGSKWSMNPLAIEEIIHFAEDVADVIVDGSDFTGTEQLSYQGTQQVDDIVSLIESENTLKVPTNIELNVDDGGALSIEEARILLVEEFVATETTSQTVFANEAALVIMSESMQTLVLDSSPIIPLDEISVHTTFVDGETISAIEKSTYSIVEIYGMSASDEVEATIGVLDSILYSEDYSSIGTPIMDYATVTIEEEEQLQVKIESIFTGVDSGEVSSENEIDED